MPECALVALGVVFLIVMVSTLGGRSRSGANAIYAYLARQFHGVLRSGGWFGYPSVRFRYGTTDVVVSTRRTRGVAVTEMLLSWPDARFRCEIGPQGWGQEPGNPFRDGSQIGTGDRRFDRTFRVVGNDPTEVRNFLTDGVRWEIQQLWALASVGQIYVKVKNGRMAIGKPINHRTIDDLDRFVQVALGLYDQAMLTRAAGIQFVEETAAPLLQDVTCQVCGESVVVEMVICRRCKTPHHMDCWQYYGACSTYGCRETRYVLPAITDPPDTDNQDARIKPR